MDNLLSIARELQLKVQSNEDSVHKVLSNAMHLQEVLHYSEEFQNNIENINRVSGRNYTSVYTEHSLTPADRTQLTKLQKENTELKTTLDDYQSTLELIMTKYREQMRKLIESQNTDSSLTQIRQYEHELQQKNFQISQMVSVMNAAVNSDDQISVEREEDIISLKYENEGLKKLLGIAESGVMDEGMIKTSRENTLLRPSKKSKSYSDLEFMSKSGYDPFTDSSMDSFSKPKLRLRDSMEGLDLVGEEDDLSYDSQSTQDSV